jgi:hypothetical protein
MLPASIQSHIDDFYSSPFQDDRRWRAPTSPRVVALLKIDVLRSGRILCIYSEVIPQALTDAGSSLEEFDSLLSSFGFEPVVISPAAAKSPRPDHAV